MIPLYVDNGAAYVWNSEDWYTLRTKYRICGSLIGSAPAFPRQNDFQGLPMALMAEEVGVLVDIGACELFELPNITKKLSDEEKQQIMALDKKSLEEQTRTLRKQRIDQLTQKIDIIFAGKRKKLLSKGETDVKLDKQTLLQEEIDKLPNIAPAHVLVHLPTEHYIKTETKEVDLTVIHPGFSNIMTFVRFAVYKNLWEKGHYITSGSKFGADFLVYPGDPVKFHATYMVKCIDSSKTFVRPANLVAFGRLAVSVNKLAVLACCDSAGHVEYQTIQWHDSING
ncbi:tRNA-splicing endonuclease subunit Sen34 [Epargyreus clarus]|uniref:tRNA-splicing endonuclease subunit Sen34 n=1 Tax=Epargyreus clarus TaxID=520877 RepID=UPI003C2D455F